LEYKRPDIVKGYADQTLYINLSDPQIEIKPVAEETKKTFIGGKGYDLWLLWNAVQPSTVYCGRPAGGNAHLSGFR
jgi:aldehyde:ferredoxin oxidoreductase